MISPGDVNCKAELLAWTLKMKGGREMVQGLLGSWQVKTIRKPQLWVDQKSRGKAENVTISDEDEDDF